MVDSVEYECSFPYSSYRLMLRRNFEMTQNQIRLDFKCHVLLQAFNHPYFIKADISKININKLEERLGCHGTAKTFAHLSVDL